MIWLYSTFQLKYLINYILNLLATTKFVEKFTLFSKVVFKIYFAFRNRNRVIVRSIGGNNLVETPQKHTEVSLTCQADTAENTTRIKLKRN